MINEATAEHITALPLTSEAAVKILAQYEAYGVGRPFLRFWECGDGGILSLMDGTAVLALPSSKNKKSADETALFLQMNPDVTSMRTDGETAAIIAKQWGTGHITTGVVMMPGNHFDLAKPKTEQAPVYTPALREVYPLLAAVFDNAIPPFDTWYADVHHRQRNGFCRVIAVKVNDTPVSTAMSVAECSSAAIIGAVATSPACRGKGYAAACVTALARELLREGKQVLLSPKNDYARQLYEKIGFTVCGSWGAVEKQ